MASENPLPHIPALSPPMTDHVISDLMGQAFPLKTDEQLSSAVMATAAPILNLWADLRFGSIWTCTH